MSLLAEVVVEEWLNRQGYFTIRGVKLGYDEIDLLAIRVCPDGSLERRHIEVQASVRPISYISRVPRQVQKETCKAANSASRTEDELKIGVDEWVEKKFHKPSKRLLLQSLGNGTWTSELVVNETKSKEEVALIQGKGIRILYLNLSCVSSFSAFVLAAACFVPDGPLV